VKVVADRIKAITEQLAAAQDDAKEAEAYAEEVEKERDDYALKLMQAINTYTEMHLDIERLSDKLATCEKYRDAYDEMGRIGTQAVRDLEAKLAKAVEAMEFWLQAQEPDFDAAIDLMQATLAELKGRPRG
jgi:F0F1-type ATP synthase membrane subunit b/b'